MIVALGLLRINTTTDSTLCRFVSSVLFITFSILLYYALDYCSLTGKTFQRLPDEALGMSEFTSALRIVTELGQPYGLRNRIRPQAGSALYLVQPGIGCPIVHTGFDTAKIFCKCLTRILINISSCYPARGCFA